MIRTESLSKRYGRREALERVSLEVPEASVFALTGPNGAGKSTLIKIVMSLVRASAGSAEVFGVDSRRLNAKQLEQIGYYSENQKLPEWMRAGYFLDYSKAFYPTWDDALAAELVREYEVPLQRRLRELSRGMKVKAALIACLAYRPRLLVLDEPFSGLDVLVREQLIESIIDRTPEATVFLASHDLAEIESFATHLAYLNEGRLEFVEEMATLFSRFREIEVTLAAAAAELPKDLPVNWVNMEYAGNVLRFTDTCYDTEVSRSEIARCFAGVREISSREMSFRSIFLALAKSRRVRCA